MSKSRIINTIAFLLGLGLLGWFIYYTGPQKLWNNLVRVGSGFLWVVLVFLAEVIMEVKAWQLTIPPKLRPGLFILFSASVAGSSINALLPGGQAGEVLKGNLLVDVVPTNAIVSSLTLYNFMYTETTLIVLFAMSFLCLVTGVISWELALALFGGIAVTGSILFAVFHWLRRGAVTDILNILKKLPILGKKITDSAIQRGRDIDQAIRSFKHQRPADYWGVMALLTGARVVGIAEIWVILMLLGHGVPFLLAAGIFTASQLFYYVTLLLPTRMGVLEGGAIGIFKLFSLPGPLGLAMEVIRRLRKLAYTGIGVILLGWLGIYKKRRQGT